VISLHSTYIRTSGIVSFQRSSSAPYVVGSCDRPPLKTEKRVVGEVVTVRSPIS
jgi:hypothetical protein